MTTSSQTSPSRTLLTKLLYSEPPNAAFPSSESSSKTAFNIVRYKLHTFILVVRLAVAIGALSSLLSVTVSSSLAAGVMTGRIVERDSGRRRVRKSVEACLYILEICEEVCRELDDSEDMEELRSCEEERVSLVGDKVVAIEVPDAIAIE